MPTMPTRDLTDTQSLDGIVGIHVAHHLCFVPTKKQGSQWERSTVWAMLRNPAYKGTACFGKTQLAPRTRTRNRALRQRGGLPARNSASHELPREQWIEIAVPAVIEEPIFVLAQERLANNKKLTARRTIEPSILQRLCIAAIAAMRCIAPPHNRAHARFITTVA